MTTTVIICATILVALVIVAWFSERHRRFWLDRDLDAMKRNLAAALDQANKAHALGSEAVNRVNDFERGHALGRR